MPLDLDDMLKRVRDDDPVGPDMRSDISGSSTYLQLKDARSQARAAERAAEAAGEPTAVPAAWATVRDLAGELLARSKDLEVAAWLIEALARLDGFAGLAFGFALVDGLIDRYWPDLHSVDEDDAEGRLTPLAGLNGIGGEGVLIQPIRMIPLVPGHPYGTHALWHARSGGRGAGQYGQDFMEARAATASDVLRAHAETARTAHAAFLRMSATLDTFCGTDAPPLANIRAVLEEVLDVYRGLLGTAWAQPPGQPRARAARRPGEGPPRGPPGPPGPAPAHSAGPSPASPRRPSARRGRRRTARGPARRDASAAKAPPPRIPWSTTG